MTDSSLSTALRSSRVPSDGLYLAILSQSCMSPISSAPHSHHEMPFSPLSAAWRVFLNTVPPSPGDGGVPSIMNCMSPPLDDAMVGTSAATCSSVMYMASSATTTSAVKPRDAPFERELNSSLPPLCQPSSSCQSAIFISS